MNPPPLNQLPTEILGEILRLHLQVAPFPGQSPHGACVPGIIALSTIEGDRKNLYSPILLGLVCRTWRDTTLSTPSLWSRIVVDTPTAHHVDHFKLWIARSSTQLLQLSFTHFPLEYESEEGEEEDVGGAGGMDFNFFTSMLRQAVTGLYYGPPEAGEYAHAILQTAVAVSDRWQTFRMSSRNVWWAPKAAMDLLSGTTPGALTDWDLTSLEVESDVTELFTKLDGEMAALKRVVIAGHLDYFNVPETAPRTPLDDIPTISIRPVSLTNEFFSFLSRHSSTLVHLEMELGSSIGADPLSGNTVTLSVLKTLTISEEDSRMVTHDQAVILDRLTLPALEKLSLRVGTGYSLSVGLWARTIPQLVTRSACTLLSLAISRAGPSLDVGVKEVVGGLISWPPLQSLNHLSLDGAFGSHNIPRLVIEDGSEPILPALTSLTLLHVDPQPGAVASLLRSRTDLLKSSVIVRLKALEVIFQSDDGLKRERELLEDAEYDHRRVYVRFSSPSSESQ